MKTFLDKLTPKKIFRYYTLHLLPVIFTIAFVNNTIAQEYELSSKTGQYFGFEKPMEGAKEFGPGFLHFPGSLDAHSTPTFSPDGKEVFWSAHDAKTDIMGIFYSKLVGDTWTKPAHAWFSGKYWDDEPSFSLDGKKLVFASKRPTATETEKDELDIWMMTKTASGWGEPEHLSFNTKLPESSPSIDSDNNIYYVSYYNDTFGDMDLYFSEYKDGSYSKHQHLGAAINSKSSEFSPFVLPDGSCLLFSAWGRPQGNGLFASFKKSDGTWSDAVFIDSSIKLEAFKRFPKLSPDGKYLFFNTMIDGEQRFYWTKADFLDSFK